MSPDDSKSSWWQARQSVDKGEKAPPKSDV